MNRPPAKSRGKEFRGRRACLVCALVKTFDQFYNEGCDNCDAFLCMRGNKSSVHAHTSTVFAGFYILVTPENNWAAGLYAASVTGHLPPATLQMMHSYGIPYRCRDRSFHYT